jgi:two-component system, OmpR family, phosphate regulon sensor histidine kinase PhoR
MTTLELTLLVALLMMVGMVVWIGFRLRQARAFEQQQRIMRGQAAPLSSTLQQHVRTSPLFHELASSLDSGLVMVDTERKVMFMNGRAEDLLTMPASNARNQGLMSLLRDYQADAMVREVVRDTEPREMTLQPIASDRTLHLRCKPLMMNGSMSGALLLIRDVTQLSILERSRRDMVANVSHELRTPLSSLKLLVETLQSEPPPDVARRMLDQMSQEVDTVIQLADELHELSQIESGRVTLQLAPGNVKTIVESALNRIQPQAERKRIVIQANMLSGEVPVLIDKRRIDQVLLNLLHNAVKFTADGGTIKVCSCLLTIDEHTPYVAWLDRDMPCVDVLQKAGRVREHCLADTAEAHARRVDITLPMPHAPGAWMMSSISDTGIGIPSQDLPRIFERFYKVDRSRTQGGTGLGLAIAKHLIEGHGGWLWVDSEEGYGSTFYFTLPIA